MTKEKEAKDTLAESVSVIAVTVLMIVVIAFRTYWKDELIVRLLWAGVSLVGIPVMLVAAFRMMRNYEEDNLSDE